MGIEIQDRCRHTFGTPRQELGAILDEVLGDFEEILHVRHGESREDRFAIDGSGSRYKRAKKEIGFVNGIGGNVDLRFVSSLGWQDGEW